MNITPNSFLPQHRINSCGTEIPVKIKSPQPNNEFFISTADGFAPREAVAEESQKIPVFLKQDGGNTHNNTASYDATAKAAAFSIMPGPSGPAIASSLEQASEIRTPIDYIPDAETKSMEKALGAIAADKISGIPRENLSQMEDSLGKSALESEFREMEISGHLEKQAVKDSSLSLSEKTALYIYTDSAYKAINNALRTHDAVKTEKFRPIIEKAEKALSKLPPYSGSVCRNANLPKEILEQHHPGAVITYSSFTSTSSEKISGFDGNAEIMIDCSPNGSKGRSIKDFSRFEYEKEVLFPPETQFTVISHTVKDGKHFIHMKEIPSESKEHKASDIMSDKATLALAKSLGALYADTQGLSDKERDQKLEQAGIDDLEMTASIMDAQKYLERDEVKNSSMTLAQKTALFSYTGTAYKEVNKALWRKDQEKIALIKPLIDKTSEALASIPSYKGKAYRGGQMGDDFFESHKPGAKVRYSAFTSTSSQKATAFEGNTCITIDCSSKSAGKDISRLSMFPRENEVLFPPDTEFTVISHTVKNGKHFIHMKEI